jgi:hypothetical protein
MPPDNEAIAEQVFAALARDWDGPLEALKDHLDRNAHRPGTATPQETQGHP